MINHWHFVQVKLCGHATLATAHILFSSGLVGGDIIEFETLSGVLTAKKIPTVHTPSASNLQKHPTGFYIELDFPADSVTEFSLNESASLISEALDGASIIDVKRTKIGDDLLVIPIPVLFHFVIVGYKSVQLKC